MSDDAKKQYEIAKLNYDLIFKEKPLNSEDVSKLNSQQKQVLMHHLCLQSELYLKAVLLSYGLTLDQVKEFEHGNDKLLRGVMQSYRFISSINFQRYPEIVEREKIQKNFKNKGIFKVHEEPNVKTFDGLKSSEYRYAQTMSDFSEDEIMNVYNRVIEIGELAERAQSLRKVSRVVRNLTSNRSSQNETEQRSSKNEGENSNNSFYNQRIMANYYYDLTVKHIKIGDVLRLEDNNKKKIFIYHLSIQAELYLKTILLTQGRSWNRLKKKGHETKMLYNTLDDNTKEVIRSTMEILSNNVFQESYPEFDMNNFPNFIKPQLYRYADELDNETNQLFNNDQNIIELYMLVNKLRAISNQQESANTLQNITPMNRRDRIQ